MEFKGLKGKWELYTSKKGNHFISGYSHAQFAKIYGVGEMNDKDRLIQKYNALLISKAPEMLEMIQHLRDAILSENLLRMSYASDLAEKLIKEATEL